MQPLRYCLILKWVHFIFFHLFNAAVWTAGYTSSNKWIEEDMDAVVVHFSTTIFLYGHPRKP